MENKTMEGKNNLLSVQYIMRGGAVHNVWRCNIHFITQNFSIPINSLGILACMHVD